MIDPRTTPRSVATLMLPKPVEAIVTRAQAIVMAMTDNPHFPSPVPPLWVVTQAVTHLQKAEAEALTRTKGAVATRNEQRTLVRSLLTQLRSYVQVMADSEPANGSAIIESADMIVKMQPNRAPRVFSAKPGKLPGEVTVIAPRAADRASPGGFLGRGIASRAAITSLIFDGLRCYRVATPCVGASAWTRTKSAIGATIHMRIHGRSDHATTIDKSTFNRIRAW